MANGPAIRDESMTYDVAIENNHVHLRMNFQDKGSPWGARVIAELEPTEALKMATSLVAAARALGADTVTFAEALLDAQRVA